MLIKGEDWKVVKKAELEFEGEEVDGLCDYTTKTIFIDSSLRGREKEETLLHEICHAIFHESHIEMDIRLEEVIVGNLGSVLAKLFKFELR